MSSNSGSREALKESDHFREYDPLGLRAATSLGRLSGMLACSRQARLFRNTWLMREAAASCALAGIETSLENSLAPGSTNATMNYHNALLYGMDHLKNHKPLDEPFIEKLHDMVLHGQQKSGEIPIPPTEKAAATPCANSTDGAVHAEIVEIMERVDINPIILAGLTHAWLMNARPFQSGNDRMARLLIPLFLAHHDLVDSTAACYMSAYFNERKAKYADFLLQATARDGLKNWINFFLRSLIEGCHERMFLLAASASLYETSIKAFQNVCSLPYSRELVDFVFANPVFSLEDISEKSGISLRKEEFASELNGLENAGLIERMSRPVKDAPEMWLFSQALEL